MTTRDEQEMDEIYTLYVKERPRGFPIRGVLREIMDRTLELAATREGTMTAEELAADVGRVRRSFASFGNEFSGILDTSLAKIERHTSALGARNAVLEAKAKEWEQDDADNTAALMGAGISPRRTSEGIAILAQDRDTWRQCAEERQRAAQQQMADKHVLEAERDALKAELATANEHVAALQAGDRAALEQLTHALGWKDGGLGWQAAVDEVRRLTSSKPTCDCRIRNIACIHEAMRYRDATNPPAPSENAGQVAEDVKIVEGSVRATTRERVAALSRLAAGAQQATQLRAELTSLQDRLTNIRAKITSYIERTLA